MGASILEIANGLRSHSGRQLIVVVRGYFDASMTSPEGVTVVAGLMGDHDEWARIESQWGGLLRASQLEQFRLTDICYRYPKEKATEVVLPFLTAVNESKLKPVYAALYDVDWAKLDDRAAYRQVFPQRQHACLNLLLGIIAEEALISFGDAPVDLFFDNDYGKIEWALAVYDDWKEREQRNGFRSVIIIDKPPKPIALQPTDMVAGLIRKDPMTGHSLRLVGAEPFSFKNKLQLRTTRGALWSFEVAREMEEHLKAYRRRLAAEKRPPS